MRFGRSGSAAAARSACSSSAGRDSSRIGRSWRMSTSAACTAAASAGRSAGLFSRSCITRSERSAGQSRTSSAGDLGKSLRWASKISTIVPPVERSPADEHLVENAAEGVEIHRPGQRFVASDLLRRHVAAGADRLAVERQPGIVEIARKPKSPILRRPSSDKNTFAGLRSRWITPIS